MRHTDAGPAARRLHPLHHLSFHHPRGPILLSPSSYTSAAPRLQLPQPASCFDVPATVPYGQMPAGQPAGIRSKKRAVVCGVLYRNSGRELKGSVNDAKSMKGMLQRRFNFPESSIRMLTEESSSYKPTKENIRRALHWLVEGCGAGDSLVFYFSGHGHQQRNYSGDEIDGSDETLCPINFETEGMIVDDEINQTIVGPLLPGVKLHAIFDACHSGTMLDLPFLCRMNRSKDYKWEDHRAPSGEWKGTKGGEAFSFSGCDDHQIAIDTRAPSRTTEMGAMTLSFIHAIDQGHATTYGALLDSIRSAVNNNELGGNTSTYFPPMYPINYMQKQEPQLTSNIQFNVYTKPFSL